MQMRNIKVNVPLVTTTAEPLMLEQRKIFKEILGAESFDQYGCGEIGGVAFECSEHEGMHITEERVIVEQTNNHDLIMTDLDNYAMPFVRYYNADQAVISNERCGCGREHRLIKQVMGRTCDYVVGMNDEYLHWAYFWHLIFDSGVSKKRDLSKFQIEQESQNKIIFKYIAKQLDKDEEKLLTDSIQSKLGNVEVVFSQEHDIPNTATGKYRPVINNLLR
jgi:phenylacetate-CoA ligase